MIVKIEGKEHRMGTSKKGKDYDFIVLHFLAAQRGVDGKAAVNKLIDPSLIEYDNIVIGQHYDIEIGLAGDIVAVSPAKA